MAAGGPTTPSLPTIKRLFAKSGDRCAFPQCPIHIVMGNAVVADICHIKAARPDGPRYDPRQTPAQRHGFENLVLLCANHHRVIDDDPEKYSVEVLQEMKRAHESIATTQSPDVIERATALLAESSVGTSEVGSAVEPVQQIMAPTLDRAQRQGLIARAAAFHRERLSKIIAGQGPVPPLDGGLLVFHVIPVESLDVQQSLSFSAISENPIRFPPVAADRPRDARISFDGLLVGSNAEGLSKPQRAFTHIFRSGIVEAVASSLARGREHNFLMLPQIQAMLIKYVAIYLRSLFAAGISPPAVVCASLASIKKMRLLQDFISTALPEDIPGPWLDRDQYNFAESFINAVPANPVDSAKHLKFTIDHLANAACLTTSPYFDSDGNYTLTP